jgi:hypothetical protein
MLLLLLTGCRPRLQQSRTPGCPDAHGRTDAGLPVGADRNPTTISPLLYLLLLACRNRRMPGAAPLEPKRCGLGGQSSTRFWARSRAKPVGPIPQAEWPWMRISATPEQRRVCSLRANGTIGTSLRPSRHRRSTRSTNSFVSSIRLKSATPRTNAGYIQCAAIGPCLFNGDGQIAVHNVA